MKIKFPIILIIILAISVSCETDNGGSRTLKFSLILGSNSDWFRGAERFKELIEERTDGRYKVKIFPHRLLPLPVVLV